jgi:uncharacterized phage protein (TIGR01671 family)
MNNRLKFRAWDKLAKRFTYPDKGYQGHYILTLNGEFHNLQNGSGGDEYIVQQWTGFVDAEGKDVYEGDIIGSVNFILKNRGVIKFGEYCGKGYYSNDGCGWFIDFKFDSYPFVKNWPKNTIVIGNIFENPELLKNE